MVDRTLIEDVVSSAAGARRVVVAWLGGNADALLAGEILARRLAKAGKEVFLTTKDVTPEEQHLPFRAVYDLPLIRRDLLVTIDAKPAPLGELRYEKEHEALRIIISPKEETIPLSAAHVSYAPLRADLVFVIGVSKLEELGAVYQENPQLFFETPIVVLGKASLKGDGDMVLSDGSIRSLTELAWAVGGKLSAEPLERDEATLIFAGIAGATDNLLDPAITSETLAVVAECAERNADRALVLGRPRRADGPIVQLLGRSMVRSRRTGNDLTLSVLTQADFAATKISPSEIQKLFPLWRPHLETSFLLLLWEDPQTNTVSALLFQAKGEQTIPEEVFGRTEGNIFFARESFASFRSAEEKLLSLFS